VELAAVIAVVAGVAWWYLGLDRLCIGQLEHWAADNGMTLASARRRPLSRLFPRVKRKRVYDIEVVDAEGRSRSGVAKVGDIVFGALAQRVAVRWD
jgi:hypothetical protein